MVEWPEVTVDVGDSPGVAYVGDVDEIALPQRVVVHGTVNGVPWTIQTYATKPGPHPKWREAGPVGPAFEFYLGRAGCFGGGTLWTRLNEGTHLTAMVQLFGSHPEVVSWVGVVSDSVDHLQLHLDEGAMRRIDLQDPRRETFPRFFWFFPPRGATGTVVAVGADGQELQRDLLVDRPVPRDATCGMSVNPIEWPGDGPPPGWPQDPMQSPSST